MFFQRKMRTLELLQKPVSHMMFLVLVTVVEIPVLFFRRDHSNTKMLHDGSVWGGLMFDLRSLVLMDRQSMLMLSTHSPFLCRQVKHRYFVGVKISIDRRHEGAVTF